jgi:hypothetical protein
MKVVLEVIQNIQKEEIWKNKYKNKFGYLEL